MPFFQINWIIIFITGLFLLGFIFSEVKLSFISRTMGIAPWKIYLIIVVLGTISAILNYIALFVFGSWEMLVMVILLTLLLILIVGLFIHHRIKKHRKLKELEATNKAAQEIIDKDKEKESSSNNGKD